MRPARLHRAAGEPRRRNWRQKAPPAVSLAQLRQTIPGILGQKRASVPQWCGMASPCDVCIVSRRKFLLQRQSGSSRVDADGMGSSRDRPRWPPAYCDARLRTLSERSSSRFYISFGESYVAQSHSFALYALAVGGGRSCGATNTRFKGGLKGIATFRIVCDHPFKVDGHGLWAWPQTRGLPS